MKVFIWILAVLAKEGLLRGKTLGVDATTLEANAALRTIVRGRGRHRHAALDHRRAVAEDPEAAKALSPKRASELVTSLAPDLGDRGPVF